MSIIYNGSIKPELDTRVAGTDLFTATASSTTSHYYNFEFTCEFNGLEIYAWDSNKGDTISLYVEYYAGELGWLRFKKFGKKFNVYPNHVNRVITFPTTPQLGVRIRVDYNCGANPVDFSLNVFQFSTREPVDISMGQQGENW